MLRINSILVQIFLAAAFFAALPSHSILAKPMTTEGVELSIPGVEGGEAKSLFFLPTNREEFVAVIESVKEEIRLMRKADPDLEVVAGQVESLKETIGHDGEIGQSTFPDWIEERGGLKNDFNRTSKKDWGWIVLRGSLYAFAVWIGYDHVPGAWAPALFAGLFGMGSQFLHLRENAFYAFRSKTRNVFNIPKFLKLTKQKIGFFESYVLKEFCIQFLFYAGVFVSEVLGGVSDVDSVLTALKTGGAFTLMRAGMGLLTDGPFVALRAQIADKFMAKAKKAGPKAVKRVNDMSKLAGMTIASAITLMIVAKTTGNGLLADVSTWSLSIVGITATGYALIKNRLQIKKELKLGWLNLKKGWLTTKNAVVGAGRGLKKVLCGESLARLSDGRNKL